MVLPIGPLMWEHRLIEKILPIVENEIKKIDKTLTEDPKVIEESVDFFRVYADKTHHGKEEDILFRELEKKDLEPEHQRIMDQLIQDHEEAREKVSKLEESSKKWTDGDIDSLKTVRQMLQDLADLYPRHIEMEDKQFFHQSMVYFSNEELEKMVQEFNEFDNRMIHWKYQKVIERLSGEVQDIQPTVSKPNKYVCTVCGYIYDSEKGDPEHNIEPGTLFEDLPDDWVCPVCYADKDEFELIE
jgi:hemerythrin-like domain-containing protein/rubredoxin